jgi:PAS domain S-box-containing protein
MDRTTLDLIEMINFTESVAVKTHGVLEEAEIFKIVSEEFGKTARYDATVVLLTDNSSHLSVAETSLPHRRLVAAEKSTGLRLAGYRIDLEKSSIWRQVVREGKTVTALSGEILREWLPRRLVDLILKIVGYEQRASVLTPLRRRDQIIGAVAVNCAALSEHVIPSIRNLGRHISSALQFAAENAQRRRAEQAVDESEQRFRQMASVIPAVFWMVSPDWKHTVYVSPAVEKIHGRTCESFYRQPELWLDVILPADRERVAAFRGQHHPQQADVQYRIVRPDGEVRWVSDSHSPVRNEAGELEMLTGFTEDITERKRSEERVRASEATTRALLNGLRAPALLIDRQGNVMAANQALAESTGKSPKELIGSSVYDSLPPDEAEFRRQLADEVIRSTKPVRREEERQGRFFEWVANPVLDAEDNVAGLAMLSSEVTQRKLAERELRESEETLRALLNAIPEPAFLMGTQGTILAANQAVAQKLGISGTELVGSCVYDLIEPVAAKSRKAHVAELIRTGKPIQFEDLRAGRHIDSYLWPVLNEQGKVARIAILGLDITERKRMEEALRRSEQRFRALIEDSSDIVVLLDSDGSPLYTSPSAKVMSGYDFEDLVGRKAADFCHPDDLEQVEQAGGQLLQNPDVSLPIRLRLRYADGSWHTVEVAARNLLHNPAVGGIVVNMRDVTERVRAEAALAQAEKLASLGVLAGGIAHQVRNPLGIISASAQLLLEFPDDKELQSQCARKIYAATERASQIIENLLQFARPGSEQMEEIRVQLVLEDTLVLLLDHIAMCQVTLRKRVQPNLPTVRGNPNLLGLVFANLVLNACDAMPQGGLLEITARAAEARWVKVQFRDTGSGIAPEDLPRVFDPFFTTRSDAKGTGLGLSISHTIIRQHQGTIEAQSQSGGGATFTVRLPIMPGSRQPIADGR